MVNQQFITNPNIQSPKILVFFTENYSLEEAVDLIKSWNPDTLSYDIVNRVPYVYAEKYPRFRLRVANLLKAGIKFQIGENILVPRLTNPPISNTQSIVENRLPETHTRDPIHEEQLRELISGQDMEISQLKTRVINLEQELAAIKTRSATVIDRALSPIPPRVGSPQVSPQVSPQRPASARVSPVPERVMSPTRVVVPQVDTDQVVLTDIQSEVFNYIDKSTGIVKPYTNFDPNAKTLLVKQSSKGIELTVNGLFDTSGKTKGSKYRMTKKWNKTFVLQGDEANRLQNQLENAANDLEAVHIFLKSTNKN